MADPAKNVVVAPDFPGLVTNIDPRNLPPGAADEQVNICSLVPGEMQVRGGYREVTFEGQ